MSRKMKNTQIDWIGEIPEAWQLKNIKNVLNERKETNNPIKTTDILSLTNDRGVIPYAEKGDVGNKSKDDLTGYKLAYENDIVLNSMNVIIGSVGISKYYGAVSPVYYMLYVKHQEDCIGYFNHIFQTKEFQRKLVGYGNGIMEIRMRIQMSKLNTVILPYPSYREQKKITDFIDKKTSQIDSTIALQKEAIQKYKEYKQSLITEAVTKGLDKNVKNKDSGIEWIGEVPRHWDVVKPKRVCQVIRGNSGFQKDNLKSEGDYVALQYGKTYKVNEVNNEFQFYVDKSFYKDNQVVEHGDTILVSTSETMEDLGHSCYYNRFDLGLLGGEQMCLRPNKSVLGKFLYYATRYFKIELNQYATGLKVYRFRVDDLKKIDIIIPTIEEQEKIVNLLNTKIPLLDSVVLSKEALIKELEEYKKSLIYEYVTGKKEVY